MRTIEAVATVTEDGKVTLQVPPGIEPGQHRVVLVIEERPVAQTERLPLDLVVMPWTAWPGDATFRRNEMYNDADR